MKFIERYNIMSEKDKAMLSLSSFICRVRNRIKIEREKSRKRKVEKGALINLILDKGVCISVGCKDCPFSSVILSILTADKNSCSLGNDTSLRLHKAQERFVKKFGEAELKNTIVERLI